MSIVESLKTYIKGYSSLSSGAPTWINYLGSNPIEYAIVPIPGARVIESYINGNSLRSYPFAFQSMESTADDLERLETQGFYEAFAEWLEEQAENGNLPELDDGKTAESIEATGWAYLYEQGESQTGIYQIQCRLLYVQELREEESEESS